MTTPTEFMNEIEKELEEIQRGNSHFITDINYYCLQAKKQALLLAFKSELEFLEGETFDYGIQKDTEEGFNLLNGIMKRMAELKKLVENE